MASWKGVTFVSLLPLWYPVVLLSLHWRDVAFPVGWLTALAIVWLWMIVNITFPFFTSPLRSLPEPPGDSFVLGQGPATLQQPPAVFFLEWMKQTANSGLIHYRSFFHKNSGLLLTSPETVNEVLNTRAYDYIKPPPARAFLARFLGEGLVVTEGQTHKLHRKSVAPAFSGRNIRDLVPTFWEKALDFNRAVANSMSIEKTDARGLRTGTIEIGEIAQRITLDIIGKAGLGRDFNTIVNSDDELARQYAAILDPKQSNLTIYFVLNLFLPQWVVSNLPWKTNRIITQAVLNLRVICKRLLAEKRAAMAEKNLDSKDILAVLLRSGAFDDDGLVDQLLTFLAAGHETTSAALTWALYLLARDQDAQQRVRDEVQAVLGSHTGIKDVAASHLDEMPFLNGVGAETLRLFPTIPVTLREAVHQTSIGGTIVPKGTEIVVCPWALNRSEEFWGAHAAEFKPERWLSADKEGLPGGVPATSPLAFLTFLHGPRSCIGQGFARTELKCLLAAFVLRFRVELQDPSVVDTDAVEPSGAISIKPKGGMHLRLTELSSTL